MSDTAVSEIAASAAVAEAVAAPVKRRPSAILADLEIRVDALHAVKATYAEGIAAIRTLKAEYADVEGEIAAVFAEVESVPERVEGWFASHL